jgi:hypothetical protein
MTSSRVGSIAVALITATATWTAWGYVHPTPVLHDESAYLFQAQTFAAGRVGGPTPRLPEFFQQLHILVAPRYASRYPPGFAAALAPAVWLGVPALVPVLLAGLTAASLFSLARSLSGTGVAILTWLVWLSSSSVLTWTSSYLSQTLTGALWLLGWLALIEWRRSRRQVWLYTIGAAVGWMAVTRPLTALAFTLPIVIVLGVDIARGRLGLRHATGSAALALVIVLALPVHNHAVLGDWRTMVWSAWATQYAPSERLGFGVAEAKPTRDLPGEFAAFNADFAPVYEQHTVAAIPSMIGKRLMLIVEAMFGGGRIVLGLAALVGLVFVRRESAVALASFVLLLAAHLPFGHAPWALYYSETLPVLAFFAAQGIAALVRYALPRTEGFEAGTARTRATAWTMIGALLALHLATQVTAVRTEKRARMEAPRRFAERARALDAGPLIVFVRYGPRHAVHQSLIANEPDLSRARVWTVHDRGADNRRLMAAFPDRAAYLFDEGRGTFVRLAPR